MAKSDREEPRLYTRKSKSIHSGLGSTESYVHIRHPEMRDPNAGDGPFGGEQYLLDIPASEDPEDGAISLDTPCNPFMDTSCYLLDSFNRTAIVDTYSTGTSLSHESWTGYSSGASSCVSDELPEDAAFTLSGPLSAPVDTSVDSSLGTGASGWTSNPGCGCGGLDFTFTGWFERSFWWKISVANTPGSPAGIQIGPVTFIAPTGLAGGTVGQAEGARVIVNSNEPTNVYDGTTVTTLANGVATTLLIPYAYVPADGNTLWVGVVPNWRADLGGYTCGFRWPWMDGQGNSAKCYVNGDPSAVWGTWDATGSVFGYGDDGDDQDAFFAGNLPWEILWTGGNFAIDGDNLTFSVDAGSQEIMTATMAGSDVADVDDDYEEDLGEPWTEETGVKMNMRFKLTTAGSTTESGRRYLQVRWQDGYTEYKATVNLGDTSKEQGLTLYDEVSSSSVDKDITEGGWSWLQVDTRNPEYLRGKLWNEGAQMGSNESPIYDVQVTATETTESGISGNFFEIEASLGNGTGAAQSIAIDRICFARGGQDCYWVQERIGQGDGLTNLFATPQPYKEGSLWFFVDGMHVRTKTDDVNRGTFQTVDTVAPDDGAILIARYRVDGNPSGD